MNTSDDAPYARFMSTLRALFRRHSNGEDNGGSLRKSLEGVLEKHEEQHEEQTNADNDLTNEEKTILTNLLQFGQIRLDDIMVPRADIIAIEETASVKELLHMFVKYHHSRTPVYKKTPDDMIAMIHIKDLVAWMMLDKYEAEPNGDKITENQTASLEAIIQNPLKVDFQQPIRNLNIMREIIFAPPSMTAADLLIKMQSARVHMAIIIDEYGGTDGIITIEDIIEEIIGDIPDEHERDNALIYPLPNEKNIYIADARLPIETAEEVLRKDLIPESIEEDIDTIGGLVFSIVNRVPVRGEVIRHVNGVEFEVLEADPRRLKKLKIHI